MPWRPRVKLGTMNFLSPLTMTMLPMLLQMDQPLCPCNLLGSLQLSEMNALFDLPLPCVLRYDLEELQGNSWTNVEFVHNGCIADFSFGGVKLFYPLYELKLVPQHLWLPKWPCMAMSILKCINWILINSASWTRLWDMVCLCRRFGFLHINPRHEFIKGCKFFFSMNDANKGVTGSNWKTLQYLLQDNLRRW